MKKINFKVLILALFIVTWTASAGLNVVFGLSNENKYIGDGFTINYPEGFKVSESALSVQFLMEGDAETAQFLSMAVIPRLTDQEAIANSVKNADCESGKEALFTGLFGSVIEGDTNLNYSTLNGSRACELNFSNAENSVIVYSILNEKDELYIALVGKATGAQEEVFETLMAALKTIKVGDEFVRDEYAYLNNRSADAKPILLEESARTKKKSIIKTDKGEIEVELYGEEAPLTVSNHITLANENFYDNLTFHRREENFVIQGGDPKGDGTGGPGYQFEDEPVKREYEKGIMAMANSGPNTNGSQFFIMLEDVLDLPKSYTIFGKVIKGIEVVEKIKAGDKILDITIADL